MANADVAKLIEIRENDKEIMKIAERTRVALESDHNIFISHGAAIPTICYQFLKQTIEFVNQNKAPGTDFEINLMQLLDIGISHRENDDAEKEGNFVPYVRPGQEFKLLVKDDAETEVDD